MRTVALDDDLAALLEQDQPLERAAREAIVMELFRRGRISTGKACELLGLSRPDFIRRAGELEIPVLLTTEEEWEADKAALNAWRERP
jgi:predicted HTH domain antitoxin